MRLGKIAIAALAGLALVRTASATNIGIDFVGGNNNTSDKLTSTQSAGVVSQTNWNDTTTGKSGTFYAQGDNNPLAQALVTYSGQSVYDVQSTTSTAPNTANGDQVLNNGAIYTNGGTANSATVTVSSLISQGSTYTVYAYLLTDHLANLSVTLTPLGGGTAQTFYAATPATPNATGYIDGTTASGFTYAAATSTTAGTYTANADYAVFTVPNTSTGFTLSETLFAGGTDVAGNGALAAVQIVGVTPEPASIGLLGVAALGLLARRKRLGA